MMEYKFIDTHCGIEKRSQCVPGVDYSTEAIKHSLKAVNVKKAFCYHYGGMLSGDFSENRDLVKKSIQKDDFFLPAYSLWINNGNKDSAEEFEKIIIEDNVRYIMMPPAGCGCSLSMFTLSDYFDIMDKHKITVGIPCTLIGEDMLASLLKEYKNVNVIGQNFAFSNVLNVRKLMKTFGNYFIDTSYSSVTGIETIVEEFGSERIVYASYAPENAPMYSAGRIILSSVSREDKDNIAYKNIMRMTGEELI